MGWMDDARRRLAEVREAAAATYDRDVAALAKGAAQIRTTGAELAREGAAEIRAHGVEWAKEGARATYDFLIGDDLKTLVDPKKSLVERGLAAVSIASNFVGPEGKLGAKVGEMALKELMEHGGEKLLAAGLKEIERRGGREAAENAEKFLMKTVPEVAKRLERLGVAFGEGIQAIDRSQSAYDAAVNLPGHVRKTVEDAYRAITDKSMSPVERARLLSEAAKNGYSTVQDVLAMKKAIDAARGHTERAQEPTPAEQRRLLRADPSAERTTIGGATMVETPHAIVDCRPGKTITPHSMDRLLEIKREHPGKMVVVVGKNLDETTKFELARAGISVADRDHKLTIDRIASKMPGGKNVIEGIDRLRTLNPAADPSSISHAVAAVYHAHKDANSAREAIEGALRDLSPATLERFRASGRAEIGIPHLQARPYDHTSRSGSVSFVDKDHVEQYVGGGEWRSYDLSHDLKGLRRALDVDKYGRSDPALPTRIEPGDRLDVTAAGRVTLTPADPSKDVLVVDARGLAEHHPQHRAVAAAGLGA